MLASHPQTELLVLAIFKACCLLLLHGHSSKKAKNGYGSICMRIDTRSVHSAHNISSCPTLRHKDGRAKILRVSSQIFYAAPDNSSCFRWRLTSASCRTASSARRDLHTVVERSGPHPGQLDDFEVAAVPLLLGPPRSSQDIALSAKSRFVKPLGAALLEAAAIVWPEWLP